MKARYTEKQFINAVESSFSYAEVARKLGLTPAGGNYKTIKNKIRLLGLSSEHMLGQAINKGKVFGSRPRKKLEEILVENSKYTNSNSLRKRLINEGIKDNVCENCNLFKWNNLPIPLELDHINGINHDNRIENLRILCPNCHAQTSNYRGKNINSDKA